MPYIPAADKHRLVAGKEKPATPGELTYLLTLAIFESEREGTVAAYEWAKCVIEEYLLTRTTRFATFAEVLGSIDAAKREYQRRRPNRPTVFNPVDFLDSVAGWFYYKHVASYEDQKIQENGDVY